jgi:hypothetical protein
MNYPPSPGWGRIPTPLGLPVPSNAHASLILQMDGLVLLCCKWFSSNSYEFKNALFQSHAGPDQLRSSHIFFVLFDNHGNKDSCNTEITSKLPSYSVWTSTSTSLHVCLLFCTSTKIILFRASVIFPLKLLCAHVCTHLPSKAKACEARSFMILLQPFGFHKMFVNSWVAEWLMELVSSFRPSIKWPMWNQILIRNSM